MFKGKGKSFRIPCLKACKWVFEDTRFIFASCGREKGSNNQYIGALILCLIQFFKPWLQYEYISFFFLSTSVIFIIVLYYFTSFLLIIFNLYTKRLYN